MRTHTSLISLLRSGLLVALVLVGRQGHAALRPVGDTCGPRHPHACASTSRSRALRSSVPSTSARTALRQRAGELGRQAGIAGLLDRAAVVSAAGSPVFNAESRAAIEAMVAAAAPPVADVTAGLVSQR